MRSCQPSISDFLRLESSADYRGPIAEAILKPALQGVVFDWDANASLVGATLGLDYNQQFDSWALEGRTRLTYNHLDTYDSSSELIEFDANITTFTLQVDVIKPIDAKVGGYPLALVGHFGNTTFIGNNRDALGFDYFFEAGLALETDISKNDWPVKKLRLGTMGIFGADVYRLECDFRLPILKSFTSFYVSDRDSAKLEVQNFRE